MNKEEPMTVDPHEQYYVEYLKDWNGSIKGEKEQVVGTSFMELMMNKAIKEIKKEDFNKITEEKFDGLFNNMKPQPGNDEQINEINKELETISKVPEQSIDLDKETSDNNAHGFKVNDSPQGLLDHVGYKEDEEKPKRSIELPGNGVLVSNFADEIVPVFKNKNLLFYREDMSSIIEIKNKEFREIKPIRFITLIEKYFVPWIKRFKKSGESFEVDHSIPQTTASAVLASPNFEDGLLKIERIFTVPIPIMYNNSLTFPKKGYDERFKSWTLHNSPTIHTDMSLNDAKLILYKIYNEFCFQTKQDYTNAIAGLLTPYLRGLFSNFNIRTPLKGYLGNRERVGKEFCAGITNITYEGQFIEESPISTGEYNSSGTNDELRKKLMSAFRQGRSGLHFSNNKGKMNNAVLEAALTNRVYSDRLLGTNNICSFQNEMDYSFSGNMGITLTPDLINRTIFTRLFLDIEDANSRTFKNPNLHEWVTENRGEILSALYSLIKNWIDKGSKEGTLPFASYPEWANICGGIMEAADLGNPCVRDEIVTQGIALDPESEEMKLLFENMYEKYPEKWIDKKTIELLIRGSEDTLMPFVNWETKSDQTKFGMKLNKNVGRLFSDIRLVVENKKIRTTRWKYMFTKEKSTFNKEKIFGNGHLWDNFKGDGHLRHLSPPQHMCTTRGNTTIGGKVAKVAKVTIKNPITDEERIKFAELNEKKVENELD